MNLKWIYIHIFTHTHTHIWRLIDKCVKENGRPLRGRAQGRMTYEIHYLSFTDQYIDITYIFYN